MLRQIFSHYFFITVLFLVLQLAMGCGLFYENRRVSKHMPVKRDNPVKVEHQANPHAAEVSEAPIATETPPDFVNPTSTSTNPLFADGVPEHLQCPPEWIGINTDKIDEVLIEQFGSKFETLIEEVEEKWNPNRPLTEIWTPMLEKYKRSLAGDATLDMSIQMLLDFPEISVLMEADSPRAFHVLKVELGEKDPDWNVAVLHDGRIFRMKTNYRYEVIFTEVMNVESGRKETKSYYFGPPDASQPFSEIVIINLDEMTDAEIENLMGWNYNINPYMTGIYKLGDN